MQPTLRQRAQQKVRSSQIDIRKMTADELKKLVYELELYQVELQMQNEELQQAQRSLSESHDRYSDLYEFAPVGYVTIDKDARIREGNLTAARMFGLDRRVLLRSNLSKFIASQSQDDWYLHRKAVFSSETKQVCEVRMRMTSGALLAVRLESVLFKSKNEDLCRTAMVDITEQKRVEEERERLLGLEQTAREAERANRAKDRFLAMVSHELRTPLTPILGWSKALSAQMRDDPTKTQALESIERNATLLSQLIEDLLDVSGFMAGKISIEFQPVDLVGVVDSAITVLRQQADQKTVRIETQFGANIGTIPGDFKRLEQVVWNLLSNAIKFTPAGGQVTLHLSRLGSDIEIIVSDTGRGISADFLPHVFDPFCQAEDRITSRRGLGLGLAIVRQIVQLHGGTVHAASGGEGKGAVFTVRLPTQITPDIGYAVTTGEQLGPTGSCQTAA
jgi:PAS domain S-box-containing protein